MRSFVIISVLIAVVAADVSHLSAYNQYRPNSYVPPASGSPFGQNGNYQTQQQYARQYDDVLTAPKFDTSYNHRQSQLQQYQSNSYQASAAQEFTPGQNPTYQQTAYTAQLQPTSYTVQQQQEPQQPQPAQELPPIVTKHFYVHAAPEEPEERAGPRYVQLGRSRKTYKVIFIKAPSYDSSARIIPVLPHNEEKTVVYVLSKKPNFEQNIQLPEQPVTEPPKPEVFFIKYKTQQEAEDARQQIQAAYDTAERNIDSNAISQGTGLLDVRSSTDDQPAASSNQHEPGQYFATPSNNYDSGAYHPQYSAAGSSNYAQSYRSSLPNYLPPTHQH